MENRLDAQGAQENQDVNDEGLEEVPRPETDFSKWYDDENVTEHNSKSDGGKFRVLQLQPLNQLLDSTKSLVEEQRLVLQKLLEFAKTTVQCRNSQLPRDSPQQVGLILHGGGGVGKSQTIKICSQWVEHILRRAGDDQHKPRVLLMCPTGMAASVIDGMTICSALDLYFGNTYKGLTDQKMAMFRSEFQELKLIIIDEMSMVSADDLYKIHHRLTDVFNNSLPFGGLSIMFVGDMLQLKPVKGRFIFEAPKELSHLMYFEEKSLWHSLESITLKHNHRQGEGSTWTQTLNRFRIGEPNDEDIALLKSRCITKLNKSYPHDALHMFFSNREVNDHNIQKLDKLKTKKEQIELVGDYPLKYKPYITPHGTVDDTNLYQTLNIKIGARIMVVLNVNTMDSLVNGSIGVVLDVIKDDHGKVNCIIVKFDNDRTGAEQRKHPIAANYINENGTPIFRQKIRYHIGKSGGKKHAATATVFQFPIKLAFAVTGHKMQGQTVREGSKVVVSLSKRIPPALGYTMISRTESIDDLFIVGEFDHKKIRCDPKALKESMRLEEISLTNMLNEEKACDALFSFGFVNIRSIRRNLEHLQLDHVMLQEELIFVTETWIESWMEKPELTDFQSAFALGKTGRGKGVGVFFKKDAKIEVCEEELYQFIKFRAKEFTIFCLYISKGCDFNELVKSLKDFNFNDKNEVTCLIGDLNFDYPGNNDLTKYLSQLNFAQLVKRATHLDGHVLDHVYVSEDLANLTMIKHHYVYYSDHDAIIVNVKNDVKL